MADGATSRARPANRRAIGVACALHKGPRGFANLVLEKQGDEIILDPHVTGECVMILDEDAGHHPPAVWVARCGRQLHRSDALHDEPPPGSARTARTRRWRARRELVPPVPG